MSISSIGAGNASQLMASLLSRIKDSGSAGSTAASGGTASASAATMDNQLTGSSTAGLSDQVLGVLVMLQGQDGSPDAQGISTGSDPVSQAFSSLDSDGDGTLSQSELEGAMQSAGGTTDEADNVFAALGGTANAGISQDSFASAAQAGGPPNGPPPGGPQGAGGGHHHRHHAGSAAQDASQIGMAPDSSQDGAVPADEWTAALQNGTGGDGTGDAGNLQQQSTGGQASLGALINLASQSYNTALTASATVSASMIGLA